jgi:hypothetical protein
VRSPWIASATCASWTFPYAKDTLYVLGEIVETNKILMELVAGFFVKKSVKEALKALARKGGVVDANSKNVLAAAEARSQNVEAVHQAMQGKMITGRACRIRLTTYLWTTYLRRCGNHCRLC